MRIIIILLRTFCCILLLFVMNSCKNEDLTLQAENKNYRNATDFIRNSFGLTLFYAALEEADILEDLRNNDHVTVFAPHDDAFHALGIYSPDDFKKMDQDSLRFMLKYHIVDRVILSADVPDLSLDNSYVNESGKELYVSGKYDTNEGRNISYYYVNGAEMQSRDNILSNGVLHVIDKALQYEEGTVQQALEKRPEFSYFVAAMKQFGYWEQLAQEGPWIVFVPRNTAFEKQGITIADIQAMNPDEYFPRLFGSYMLNNQLFVSDLHVLFGNENKQVKVPVTDDGEVSNGFYREVDGLGRLFLRNTVEGPFDGPISEIIIPTKFDQDHLTDNGIYHTLDDLLISPTDAIRESN